MDVVNLSLSLFSLSLSEVDVKDAAKMTAISE